ncbi:unnamed protein product [Victoria cruziana]
MASSPVPETNARKPHALCVPFPLQGHITPHMQLAKFLHSKGFHITFVNTEHNHRRLERSRGPDAVKGLKDFKFVSMPDGLPPSDADRTQDIPALCHSVTKNFLKPFVDLVVKLNESADDPPVTCIVSNAFMGFTLTAGEQLGLPVVFLWTASACGFWTYFHYVDLFQRGYTPFTDEKQMTNGYLETKIDWIPGMPDLLLKDIPSFIRTLNRDDTMFNFCMNSAQMAARASALILNTFEELEHEILEAIRSRIPYSLPVGPLLKLSPSTPTDGLISAFKSSLWKEDKSCLNWLDQKEVGSVIYVNFGSITVMSSHQLLEFAWGLANSKHPFLWVIRPDLVKGEAAVLPEDFILETRERGLTVSWCPQELVLNHPSVGFFLTHNGWNSTLESICAGVPMLSWPFHSEQMTNCKYACTKWGIATEVHNNAAREEIEGQVRECMEGEKGKEMRKRAKEWKESAGNAVEMSGTSYTNLERVINEVMLNRRPK